MEPTEFTSAEETAHHSAAIHSLPIPLISNVTSERGMLNAGELFWLPPDTPWGNLQGRLFDIVLRVDYVNNLIERTYGSFPHGYAGKIVPSLVLREHVWHAEEVIYWLRRTADDILMLVGYLEQSIQNSNLSESLPYDSIGTWLGCYADPASPDQLSRHREYCRMLANTSNAFKHSFLQSEATSNLGTYEPYVFVMYKHRNEFGKGIESSGEPLCGYVNGFSAFFGDALELLRQQGSELQPIMGGARGPGLPSPATVDRYDAD